MAGVSEIELSTTSGESLTRASIHDLSGAGLCVFYLAPEAFRQFAKDDKVRFKFRVPTGAVSGEAVIVRADEVTNMLGLRIVRVDDAAGQTALSDFLGSPFCGVQ